jgi:hypothetical protein
MNVAEARAPDPWGFKRAALIYPQPVAFACGRLLRASRQQDRIDAVLKAAEVLCRYLSALALSSLGGRQEDAFPDTVKPLTGDLSFGHFLAVVQSVAKLKEHPLESYLVPFRPQGKGKGPGKADAPLVALLGLRNELGHDLATFDEARAETVLHRHDPEQLLLNAFSALDGVLSLPLFVLHNVGIEKKQIVGQRLLLMGENPDPIPDRIELAEALDQSTPYVALDDTALVLPPVVLFGLIEEQCSYRLAFLDAVNEDSLRYKTLDSHLIQHQNSSHEELSGLFAGTRRPLEDLRLLDGSKMRDSWGQERRAREIAGKQSEGRIPWDNYSQATLAWYAARLPGTDTNAPVERITEVLLDGRTGGLSEDELRQLTLLFGVEGDVRSALGREMSDLRAITEPGQRWDERLCGSKNIPDTLIDSIEFFARRLEMNSAESADLANTGGSADYIAMREALVNQFIHQDYSDASAAAQIELSPQRAVFFNTGHSLVTQDHLVEGGKSQARNPLIARAFRLIKFAELAGSGIRALQHAWREAQRRPPVLESDRVGNTFSLTLDWREVPNAYDEVWKKRLGVQLTDVQAMMLNLATDPAGITDQQAAAGTGMSLAETRETLRYLVHQVLVEEHAGRFHLKDHLKEALL